MLQQSQVDGPPVLDVACEGAARYPVTVDRVAELESALAHLRAGLESRQRLGVATGIVAERFGLTPEQAWALLVRVSQDSNVKVREVGRLVLAASRGRLEPADEALAHLLERQLPPGSRVLFGQSLARR